MDKTYSQNIHWIALLILLKHFYSKWYACNSNTSLTMYALTVSLRALSLKASYQRVWWWTEEMPRPPWSLPMHHHWLYVTPSDSHFPSPHERWCPLYHLKQIKSFKVFTHFFKTKHTKKRRTQTNKQCNTNN